MSVSGLNLQQGAVSDPRRWWQQQAPNLVKSELKEKPPSLQNKILLTVYSISAQFFLWITLSGHADSLRIGQAIN